MPSRAVLYGLHQIFTKLASSHISDGFGGLVVEGTATATIALYLLVLWLSNHWEQKGDATGVWYSALTGICGGAGTISFFYSFKKGGRCLWCQ